MNSRWILSCEKKMFSKKKKSTNLAGQRPWTWVIGGSSKEREQRWQSLKVIGSVPTMTEGLYPEELMSPNAVIKIYGFRGALHENLTHRPSHRPVSTKSQSYHWTAALQESELLSPICSLKMPMFQTAWSQTIVIKVLHNAPNKWAVWVDEGEETDQKVAVGQWTTKKRRNALLSFINPFIFCDTKPASIFFFLLNQRGRFHHLKFDLENTVALSPNAFGLWEDAGIELATFIRKHNQLSPGDKQAATRGCAR